MRRTGSGGFEVLIELGSRFFSKTGCPILQELQKPKNGFINFLLFFGNFVQLESANLLPEGT